MDITNVNNAVQDIIKIQLPKPLANLAQLILFQEFQDNPVVYNVLLELLLPQGKLVARVMYPNTNPTNGMKLKILQDLVHAQVIVSVMEQEHVHQVSCVKVQQDVMLDNSQMKITNANHVMQDIIKIKVAKPLANNVQLILFQKVKDQPVVHHVLKQ